MTYSDNRNRNRTRGGDNTAAWIIGVIAVLVVIGAIAWGISGSGDQTASTGNTPATTTGQTGTTGAQSGTTGSTPAPSNAPANR
jgi:hypothetical protein